MYKNGRELTEQYHFGQVVNTVLHYGMIVWESISSTFFDCFGNPFYDKDGVPFQGKPE